MTDAINFCLDIQEMISKGNVKIESIRDAIAKYNAKWILDNENGLVFPDNSIAIYHEDKRAFEVS